MNSQIEKPDYGNWTPRLLIYVPLAIALLFLALSLLWFFLLIPGVFFVLVAAFLSFVRFKLSPTAGNVQESIWNLVIEHLDWNGEGRALDIGCGNGALKLAQKHGVGGQVYFLCILLFSSFNPIPHLKRTTYFKSNEILIS